MAHPGTCVVTGQRRSEQHAQSQEVRPGHGHAPTLSLSTIFVARGKRRSWRSPMEGTKATLSSGMSTKLIHRRSVGGGGTQMRSTPWTDVTLTVMDRGTCDRPEATLTSMSLSPRAMKDWRLLREGPALIPLPKEDSPSFSLEPARPHTQEHSS